MKLSEYKADSYEYSKIASNVVRNAAYAGIAVIWVFRFEGAAGTPELPSQFYIPLMLFVFGIAFDILQYIVASGIWWGFYHYQENKHKNATEDLELSHSCWLVRPIDALFLLKVIAILSGYIKLGALIIGQLK